MIRLIMALLGILSLGTSVAVAQIPGEGEGKASLRVLERMAAGTPQDLIVIYDDKAIQKKALARQSEMGLTSSHHDIVEYKSARYAERKREALSAFGTEEATVLKHYSHLPVNFVRIHSKKALEKLLASPDIVHVYENRLERMTLANSLPLIGQPQAAAIGDQGAGTTVAVLDSGVDYSLPTFGSCTSPGVPAGCKVVYAQDFAPADGKLDSSGHGTNVAAIVLGVAPGTKIAALDVFSGSGAYTTDILSAINWVIANKATYNIVAINLSLGSGKYTSPETTGPYNATIDQARAAGILTIAASGNDGYTSSLSSPAAVPGVVSVGAVYDSNVGSFNWNDPPLPTCTDTATSADKPACFSNSASFLTLVAPGCEITAGNLNQYWCGTSQAAPHVAGAVAVLRAAFPSESPDQTVARLTNGVMVTDSRNDIIKPRLDLPLALGISTQCVYAISRTSASFSSSSSNGSISVTTGSGCTWGVASNREWISVTSATSASGTGTVSYSVSENTSSTSRTGVLQVAGKTFTVSQSGAVGTVANILLNSDFESGPVSWTSTTANGAPLLYTYSNGGTPGNSWYAWLCGYDNCSDRLYQDVTIPADAQGAVLQFKYWITTSEVTTTTAYDSLAVRIYSPPSASTSASCIPLSNLNATTGWVQSTGCNLIGYKGQTIRIQFSAVTDSGLPTDFFIDGVSLMVSGATPDTQSPTVPAGLTATAISTSAINLSWTASSDNVAVTANKIYRDGALLATVGDVRSYGDTGLVVGTSYSYTVSACDAAGNCSPQSAASVATTAAAFSDTQPPTVPANFKGTATSVSAVNLSWAPSSDNAGVTQYNIYRNGTLLANLSTVTTYGDTGLTPFTTYSYTVSACDASGNCSSQSPAISVSTLSPFSQATPIVIDGAISTNTSGNLVNISIAKITNQSLYYTSGSLRIELWAYATPFTGAELGYKTASIRTSAITGLSDQLLPNTWFSGTTLSLPYTPPPAGYSNFAIFVEEYSTSCTSSDHFCYDYYVNLHEMQAPTVPTGVTATAVSSSQINLIWTASSDNVGVATYKVYRSGTLEAILGNVTSYSSTGLTASAAYSYQVSACDAVGNCSAQSVSASATTAAAPDTQPPTVPTGLTATAISSSQINLAWSASADNVGVTAYKIYSAGTLVATLGNVTSASRTNAPSTTYRYAVSACDAAGNCSAQSVSASATTPAPSDSEPPTVPTELTATAVSGSQINLSWTASSDNVGVTAYKIYSGGNLVSTLGNVTSFGHTGLRDGTTYTYTVMSCDLAGNCSATSTAVSGTTLSNTVTLNLNAGWNLLGNSSTGSLDTVTTFGDATKVSTIWKWIANSAKWAFYAPSLSGQALSDYAIGKGYDVLTTITGGEGFWVNAKTTFTAQLPSGAAILSTSFQTMGSGWNLASVGETATPKQFCDAQSTGITTLWAWDATNSAWYFYAPSLEASGGLSTYITSKGYLDFTGNSKTLGPGVGFWVNKP